MVTSQSDTTRTTYTRLAGGGHRRGVGASIFSRCRLYLGNDHLLALETSGFTENYRRFFFADIQAIVTIRTKKWNRLNIILPVIVIAWFFLSVLVDAGPARVSLTLIGAIFLVAFMYHLLRGPTCDCYVITAVQKEHLPSLGRIRLAIRVITILTRSIEAVQGPLDKTLLRTSTFDIGSDIVSPNSLSHGVKAEDRHHSTGTIHLITFLLLFGGGLMKGLDVAHHTREFALVSYVMFLSGSALIFVALAKQKGSDLPSLVRRLTWVSVAFAWTVSLLNGIIGIASALEHLKAFKGQFDFYESVLNVSPLDSSFMLIYSTVTIVCALFLSVPGIMAILKHRRISSDFAASHGAEIPVTNGPHQ
jgi:hypothetical protein